MRSTQEIEIENAKNILLSMGQAIEEMEGFWPKYQRGSNAERCWDRIKTQRGIALQCLIDAESGK